MFYIRILFIKNKFSWLIKNFKSKKIKIGDLVYDIYIRYDLKFSIPQCMILSFQNCYLLEY